SSNVLAIRGRRRQDRRVHRRDDDEKRYEIVEVQQRSFEARDASDFDRIAFAMATLDQLRPKNLKVVVYDGGAELRIERGRDWARGPRAEWATVAIPRHASRAHIAFRLAELVGRAEIPFVVDALL